MDGATVGEETVDGAAGDVGGVGASAGWDAAGVAIKAAIGVMVAPVLMKAFSTPKVAPLARTACAGSSVPTRTPCAGSSKVSAVLG